MQLLFYFLQQLSKKFLQLYMWLLSLCNNFPDKCLQTNDVQDIILNFDKNTYKIKSTFKQFLKGAVNMFVKRCPVLIIMAF